MKVLLFGITEASVAYAQKSLDRMDFKPETMLGPTITDELARVSAQARELVPLVLAWGPNIVDLVSQARAFCPKIAIIVLGSEMTADVSRIFSAGADEVISKVMSVSEGRARIHAVMRRTLGTREGEIRINDLLVPLDGRPATFQSIDLPLTPSEHSLLVILAVNSGRPMSREVLYAALFAACETLPFERIVDVHVSNIRKKLSAAGCDSSSYLRTMRGRGYVLEFAGNDH